MGITADRASTVSEQGTNVVHVDVEEGGERLDIAATPARPPPGVLVDEAARSDQVDEVLGLLGLWAAVPELDVDELVRERGARLPR